MPVYPLTTVQQAVWVDQLLTPETPCYNIGVVWHIHQHFDSLLFQQAVSDIIRQYDAFSINLFETENGVMQTFSDDAEPVIIFHDFSQCDRPLIRAREKITALFGAPFGLYRQRLWRCHLLTVSDSLRLWLLSAHHLVADGASIALVSRLVLERYKQLLAGDAPVLTPSPGYADFCADDQRYQHSARYPLDRAYWLDRFANIPPRLLERRQGYSEEKIWPSRQYRRSISLARYRQMEDYAARHGVAATHLITALLACCLARLWQAEELVIGLPVHNRNGARFRQTSGMFSSMIPLRLKMDGQQSFPALMQQVSAELRRSYRHQRYPIADLNRQLRLSQQGRRQLYDLSFSREVFLTDIDLPDCQALSESLHHGFEQLPLSVYLRYYHQHLEPQLEFNLNQAWFSDADAEALVSRLAHLLEAVLDAPADLPIAQLPLLLPQEQRQIMQQWNDTRQPWPLTVGLHQLFEQQAARTPQSIALCGDFNPVSYRQLNQQANQLAWTLRASGVGRDDRVALCVRRSTEMVVALLAILKAGAAWVPLDPAYPPHRLRYMLEDCGAKILLLDDDGRQALDVDITDNRLWFHLQQDRSLWQAESEDNLPAAQQDIAAALAYVIYTSGSTGQPKGVMNEHRGVVNRLLWMQQQYQLTPQDSVLQKTPFSFDVSVWEFFWPLMVGARLVLAKAGGHQDPVYLSELIAAQRVTTLHFVPSMLQLFLRYGEMSACASLTRIFCSGEALPPTAVERCHLQLPAVELHNLYGPTEAAIDVSYWHCQRNQRCTSVPVGYPVANTRLYIVDNQLQLLPPGARGELVIGGVQLARGYLNLPELSAARFIADPFSDDPQARLYRTGDLARWRQDGSIEYLGRNDFQLKIHGLRIEPGEIEQQLCRYPGIENALVVACDAPGGDKQLIAWVCAPPSIDLADDLRRHLRATLPEFMLPARVIRLDAMPLSANGKLQRDALPLPPPTEKSFRPPEGADERQLAGWWQSLLGIERIGRDDDFFALGGHSLHAIQLMLILKRQGISIAIRQLFVHSTLQAQAQAIFGGDRGSDRATAPLALEKLLRQLNQPVDSFQLIQPLNPRQATDDLWMIHPAVVSSEIYQDVAQTLTGTFNAIGVNNYNLFNHPHINALPALASYYLQYMANFGLPRNRPVRLLGWSLGGIIALEIAAQLEQRGFKHIQLCLLDSLYQTEIQQQIVPGMLAPVLNLLGIRGEAARRARQAEQSEIDLNNQCLSAPLRHSQVTLLKATQFVDLSEAGGVDGRALLAIADNGLAKVCPHLRIIPLPVNHHSIILCHQEIAAAFSPSDRWPHFSAGPHQCADTGDG